MDRFYLSTNKIGCYMICDQQRAIPELPGQRWGYTKRWLAQSIVDDLNAGRETPEGLYKLWTAGERKLLK